MSKYERCRERAIKKLPYKCVECGWIPSKVENEIKFYKLSVHHKDLNKNNCKIDNLELLCYPDHDLKHTQNKNKIPKILNRKKHLQELMLHKNEKGNYGCEFCNHESMTRNEQKQHHWHCKQLQYKEKV